VVTFEKRSVIVPVAFGTKMGSVMAWRFRQPQIETRYNERIRENFIGGEQCRLQV
jgi:hypothetical protein